MTQIIDGKKISQEIKDELREQVAEQKKLGKEAALAVIQVGTDPASSVYVNNKKKACAYIGIGSLSHELPEETTEEELLALVEKLNGDASVNGILVQLPLPEGLDSRAVLEAIRPEKDVDAFHPENVGRLMLGLPRFLPCTPAGVMALLRAYGISPAGKHCVVIGRSNIVGKPMALLLLAEDATVTVCHTKTVDVAGIARKADILVSAAGVLNSLTKDYVSEGQIVIDVSINWDPEKINSKGGKGAIAGDAKFDEVEPIEISDDEARRVRLYENFYQVNAIDPALYAQHDVKRGLRNADGTGVIAGLTNIANVHGYVVSDGEKVADEGMLRYRGYDIHDLVDGFVAEQRFGYEEVAYLLIFGRLPQKQELQEFQNLLGSYRTLPTNFVRDVIMKAPGKDMMNTLQRGVLTLYGYDDMADDISIPNVLRQCLQLTSTVPLLAVYGYQAYNHYVEGKSFYIHSPKQELSTAENILRMLRPNKKYTPLEARVLDIALVLHMDHGGGNNSTFTNHVVTSSGTDTYSAMAASLGSLKGPKHGGANIKVVHMFDEMKQEVKDWKDEDEIKNYLLKLLNKEAFDHSGLIYGMGHAVYSISDPRARIFKGFLDKLAREKGYDEEFEFYDRVEKLAVETIQEKRRIYKGVSANIDFYSGFMYRILGLPDQLFTPMFAVARMVGWSAHRLEELMNCDKIIRPAYQSVAMDKEYVPMKDRIIVE